MDNNNVIVVPKTAKGLEPYVQQRNNIICLVYDCMGIIHDIHSRNVSVVIVVHFSIIYSKELILKP